MKFGMFFGDGIIPFIRNEVIVTGFGGSFNSMGCNPVMTLEKGSRRGQTEFRCHAWPLFKIFSGHDMIMVTNIKNIRRLIRSRI